MRFSIQLLDLRKYTCRSSSQHLNRSAIQDVSSHNSHMLKGTCNTNKPTMRSGSKQLISSPNPFLKHPLGIILPAHGLQTSLVQRSVPIDRLLPRSRVVEVLEPVEQAGGLGRLVDRVEKALLRRIHACVVRGAGPRNGHLAEDEWAVRRIETERVPAQRRASFRDGGGDGLHGQGVDHVGDVCEGWDGGVPHVVDGSEETEVGLERC